ncbi:U-box domain-containing protein 52-like [Typha angustifolia]|uniref:U-box domain-containing protein 52-like n=1 Tax=Typha angustifolia TaxID=59011 RepID=UPI003C2BB9A2
MTQKGLRAGAAFPSVVAVVIDKDKGSQGALKWALDHIIFKGQTVTLIHVHTKASGNQEDAANAMRELFIPFRCFFKRKDVSLYILVYCKDVVLEGVDVAKAIIDFVWQAAIEKLVVAAPSRGFARSLKATDVATSISKGAPDFCTVYIISKGKLSSLRNAARPATSPPAAFRPQIQNQSSLRSASLGQRFTATKGEAAQETLNLLAERDSVKSPLGRGWTRVATPKRINGDKMAGRDMPFVSLDNGSKDGSFHQRLSDIFDHSLDMVQSPGNSAMDAFIPTSYESFSSKAAVMEDIEAEMRRLQLELKQTMDMYSNACREALAAKQKAMELNRMRMEEERRVEEARMAEEAALAMAEEERAKCMAAMEAAEESKRVAEVEAEKRMDAEEKAVQEAEEKKRALHALALQADVRYRRYAIEEIEAATDHFAERRKIGEGGYGPVYRCLLHHTPVAVKVLRHDVAQGRSQFQHEVEMLSRIRHPNMVLLLGACPEYGCLVYEYMANGSLEDRLFRRGNTPPIPWQHRFRIAAEITTGLLFLHQTKPAPIVHRDLNPANILLDRNYVSKVIDVGLAQYRTTSSSTAAARTSCYVDPEYHKSGMLGTKSDVYSLGIMLLQLITGMPPAGIKQRMEKAIEAGMFEEMLDPTVADWPVEEALRLARVSLTCAELHPADRPDLGPVVLPELNRLREATEEKMEHCAAWGRLHNMPMHPPGTLY